MINVEREYTGQEDVVRVTVDGIQIMVREQRFTRDIIVDTFVSELPVTTLLRAVHSTYLRVFKLAVNACNIEMETR